MAVESVLSSDEAETTLGGLRALASEASFDCLGVASVAIEDDACEGAF